MNLRNAALISTVSLGILLSAPMAHAASVQVFTDRTSFEAALSGVTVDNLDNVPLQYHYGSFQRPGYQYTTTGAYGCTNSDPGCGDNSSLGFDNSYLLTYRESPVTFTFASAVNGFGFDFSSPRYYDPVNASIDGVESPTTSGFFGLVYSDARNSFTLSQNQIYMLIDNVTAGQSASADVPEPSMLGLMGIGVLGAALARRRKSAASAA